MADSRLVPTLREARVALVEKGHVIMPSYATLELAFNDVFLQGWWFQMQVRCQRCVLISSPKDYRWAPSGRWRDS